MRRGGELTPIFLRRLVRSSEIGLSLFAGVIGVVAAGFVAMMSAVGKPGARGVFQPATWGSHERPSAVR
jgi:hypothetical protein